VSRELLNDGRPLVVSTPNERIGQGPWARLFATAVVPDEGSSTAERGRALARAGAVHSVDVAEGMLAARIDAGDGVEHAVTIAAAPVPPRIWAAVRRTARGKDTLEAAVEGRRQSVQLEHQMSIDWEEPLVPRTNELGRTCTCDTRACEHVAAVAYVLAHEIDRDPAVLLRWRGCVETARTTPSPAEAGPAPVEEPAVAVAGGDDVWRGGPLPEPRPLRPLPVGAVMKRLGPSGLRVGREDLADVLLRAYGALARRDA
jgi:hypothetical protein